MKQIYLAVTILFLTLPVFGKRVDLRGERLPGLRVSYANTVILEGIARRRIKTTVETNRIEVTLHCYKKYKVRGRDSIKTYHCDPIEMAAPVEPQK